VRINKTRETHWTKRRFLIIEHLIHVLCLEDIQERGLFEVQTVMGLTLHWSTVQSIDMLVVHLLFKNGRPIRFCLLGSIGLHDGSVSSNGAACVGIGVRVAVEVLKGVG